MAGMEVQRFALPTCPELPPRPQVGRELDRAKIEKPLPGTMRGRLGQVYTEGPLDLGIQPGRRITVWPVDRHLGQPTQQAGAPVGWHMGGQQFWPLLDEGGRNIPGDKGWVLQDRLQKWNVGADPADPELGQGATRPRDRRLERPTAAD